MSLRKVEAATGVFAAHLSEIERGVRVARPEQIETLSTYYGVDPKGWKFMLVHSS